MDTTYVCGHRNPDTDSIVSAIAYATLRNALGDNGYVAARIGHLNDETAFLLKRFGFERPLYISTVRTQIRDIDFDRPPLLNKKVPVSHAWDVLQSSGGLSADMESIRNPAVKDVPIFNLLAALEGRILNEDDSAFDTVSGEVVIALPGAGAARTLKPSSVVLCGQQEDVVQQALEQKASCVILCQGALAERYRGVDDLPVHPRQPGCPA